MAEERVISSARQASSSPEAGGLESRIASATVSSSTFGSNGLVRKLNTPRRVAVTASGMVPCAVRITTGSEGESRWIASNSAIPSMPCMRRSVTTTCGRDTARRGERRLARLHRGHRVARGRQPHRDQLQQVLVVVDQQDPGILVRHYSHLSLSARPLYCCGASLRSVGKRTRRTARQCYTKMTAGSPGDHGDLAAVRLDQLARDGEAQAAALDPDVPPAVACSSCGRGRTG